MIMDTKIICFISAIFLFSSCDPSAVEKLYLIRNDSGSNIQIILFQNGETNSLKNFSSTQTEIKSVSGLGTGGFGDIGIFDSIKLQLITNQKMITWKSPMGVGYIDIDENIGEERTIPKDIYNRKNWLLEMAGDDEHWIFEIYEKELDLFE